MLGVGLFVTSPSAGPVITGSAGSVVSTVNVTSVEGWLTLPASSVWVAVKV